MSPFSRSSHASSVRIRLAAVPILAALFAMGLLTSFATIGQAYGAPDAKRAGTAVPLGTTASFAVLAGTAISNVPISTITGNVGLSPASGSAITGLTCTEVTGTIYSIDAAGPLPCRVTDPARLTTAKNNLTTAYNNAAGRIPDSTFSGGDNQLGGKTLTAGVYRFGHGSTANLIGDLTLSGDASSVWIFQATSDLVTATSSRVILTGGAQACNVFWQVGSAATLNASSTFRGTILAHDDISLGSQVTVYGRLLAGGQASHAGAVTLIQDTITRQNCATTPPTTSPPPTSGPPPTSPTSTGGHNGPPSTGTPPSTPIQVMRTPGGSVGTGDHSTGTGSSMSHRLLAGAFVLTGVGGTLLLAWRRRTS
jgi:Ice-binding-like